MNNRRILTAFDSIHWTTTAQLASVRDICIFRKMVLNGIIITVVSTMIIVILLFVICYFCAKHFCGPPQSKPQHVCLEEQYYHDVACNTEIVCGNNDSNCHKIGINGALIHDTTSASNTSSSYDGEYNKI